MNEFFILFIVIYAAAHFPAFVLLIAGVINWNKNRKDAKQYFIAAIIYFIIGGGICASILT